MRPLYDVDYIVNGAANIMPYVNIAIELYVILTLILQLYRCGLRIINFAYRLPKLSTHKGRLVIVPSTTTG